MNILVVEDHGPQRRLADEVLTTAGHHVQGAACADAALDAIRSHLPDVVLLDLKLPGLDGLALARRLKADPATRAVPIVAFTALPEEFPRAAALAAGCDAYLVKPVSTRTLPEMVVRIAQTLGESRP
jgi:CheY-like chemotaxis protein